MYSPRPDCPGCPGRAEGEARLVACSIRRTCCSPTVLRSAPEVTGLHPQCRESCGSPRCEQREWSFPGKLQYLAAQMTLIRQSVTLRHVTEWPRAKLRVNAFEADQPGDFLEGNAGDCSELLTEMAHTPPRALCEFAHSDLPAGEPELIPGPCHQWVGSELACNGRMRNGKVSEISRMSKLLAGCIRARPPTGAMSSYPTMPAIIPRSTRGTWCRTIVGWSPLMPAYFPCRFMQYRGGGGFLPCKYNYEGML